VRIRHKFALKDLGCFAVACALWIGAEIRTAAQVMPTTAQPDQPAAAESDTRTSTNTNAPGLGLSNTPTAGSASSQGALGAAQILGILEDSPEAVIEVKSLLADGLRQKGMAVQADAISDEQLFTQIVSSSELRANVTFFLRARGYVSDEMLRRSANAASGMTEPLRAASPLTSVTPGAVDLGYGFGSTQSLTEFDALRLGSEYPRYTPPGLAPRDEREPEKPQNTHNVTDQPDVLHRPAPYNLRSLRDLYTQVPDSAEHLVRFGSEVFRNRATSALTTSRFSFSGSAMPLGTAVPLDVPLGPDYVLGPGDELSINMWGGVTQSLTRAIDPEGRVMLPESGEIQVAGLSLDKAQDAVSAALQPQFRNAHVSVTVARLRTIRVYVVGDVQRPGPYDINSLSSPLSALSAAGGPTAVGSLRVMRHYRNEKLLGEIDLYDFLLHGLRSADQRLQGGDTLLIPPAGPQVAVYGAVKRPAIYELRGERTLTAVMDDAGGLSVAAALGHITVERIVANQRREEISLTSADSEDVEAASAALAEFDVKDGDRVHVATVLPYSERSVYLQGHVTRPGKLAYRDGLRLSDVIRTYQDLLPEPAERGEIVRLVAPDLHPETILFNVSDVLVGNSNRPLQPFDTIHIFGRYEQDAPTVQVQGEVLRPGSYPLFEGMTAAQLVRAAGGFKRDALLDTADLISYRVEGGSDVSVERRDLKIGEAVLKQDHEADAALKAGDVLTIHQLTGWNDIGASITVEGEVAHPGSYGFKQGEHLSDVLKRAGGFRSTAYPEGSVLTRPEVAALEEKSREELIHQIEASSAAARLSPATSGEHEGETLQLIQQQKDQVLASLKNAPATGRMVIGINADIASWAGTAADIEVRSGDVLRIPKRPGFVLISGQVYNASAITYAPGKRASWYLEHAGGATSIANRKEIFVVRANGSVVGRRSGGLFEQDVLSTRLNPGDVIVVPQKIIGASMVWRNLLATAQIAASIAITAAVAGL
jgi:protein involved in polysaccharide export with SLBB domain